MHKVNIYGVIKGYHGYRVKPELGRALKVSHEHNNRYIYLDIQYTFNNVYSRQVLQWNSMHVDLQL